MAQARCRFDMPLSVKFVKQGSVLKEREKLLKDIARRAVYVGIADDDPENKRRDGTIKNSELGRIHENGAPAANIPARPVLKPGVARQMGFVKTKLREALTLALDGKEGKYIRTLESLGLKVAQGVKEYMSTADLTPLKGMRKSELKLLKRTPKEEREKLKAQIIATRQPLIDTGALRNAIDSYVIKE